MRYRFMAQFGQEKAIPLIEIRIVVNEVLSAANTLSRLWPRDQFITEDQWIKNQEQISKYEAKFWSMMSEEDELANRVKNAVSEMEKVARAEIEGQGTLFSFINQRIGR